MTFSHIDENNRPGMVDVGDKAVTRRTATAESVVRVPSEVMALLADDDIQTKKGPVFQTAIVAGTMAVKKTSDLIPLCHPLAIDQCAIAIDTEAPDRIAIRCTVGVAHKTGVEMEALTGASVAALTVYDMCKAFGHDMVIETTRLIEKTGGKSGYRADDA